MTGSSGTVVLGVVDRELTTRDDAAFSRYLGLRLLHIADPTAWTLGSRLVREDADAPALIRVVRRADPSQGVEIQLAWAGRPLEDDLIERHVALVNRNLANLDYELIDPLAVPADQVEVDEPDLDAIASLGIKEIENWLAQASSEALARAQGQMTKTLFYWVPALRAHGFSDEVQIEANLDLTSRRAVLILMLFPEESTSEHLRLRVHSRDGSSVSALSSPDGVIHVEGVAVTESSPSDLRLTFSVTRGAKPRP